MKRRGFDETRDQKVANEVAVDRALMCCAGGCPNRWTFDDGHGRMCSAHYGADPRSWPRITQELLDAEVDRARLAESRPPRQPIAFGRTERMQLIARTRANLQAFAARRVGSLEWAHRLRQREIDGEKLTEAQREMWRGALGQALQRQPSQEELDAAVTEEETRHMVEAKVEQRRRVADYAAELGIDVPNYEEAADA